MGTHTILLAEDSEDEVFFFSRAFRGITGSCSLQVVSNGARAIDYLSGTGPFANRRECPLPSFMLLDIKLPLLTGLEVLQWVRSDSTLKDLPVAMFTHCNQMAEINRAQALGADAYFVKPARQQEMDAMLKSITQSWLKCGVFPELRC
ncbi:MAG: response regulator with CheY-like receiver domain and winged-helix DNA-binding domain [Pedosphaera sp.]|nr:response regulator with CheY-like receiver domain and winged-helix DNA-binding domain [Pedosphaera sp.]